MGLDVEDGDEKTRRNLVVASGALITAWIAGIPVPVVMEKLVGREVQLSYWRVFLAALLVLTYMTLRFRFASDTKAAYQNLKAEWRSECCAQIRRAVDRWLMRYTRTGEESKFFGGSLSKAETEATKSIAEARRTVSGERPELGRPRVVGHMSFVDNYGQVDIDPFNSRVHVQYEWNYRSQVLNSTGNLAPEFNITGVHRFWLKAKALVKLVSYTESSLQVLVPAALATIAFCGLVIQLGMSLYLPFSSAAARQLVAAEAPPDFAHQPIKRLAEAVPPAQVLSKPCVPPVSLGTKAPL